MSSAGTAPTPPGSHAGPALDPAEAQRLIAGTDAVVRSSLRVDARRIYVAWGIAWVVSYLAFFLGHRADRSPAAWAFLVLAVTMTGAMALTVLTSVRAARGLRGASRRTGRLVAAAWYAAFIGAYGLLGLTLSRAQAPALLSSYLYALVPVLLVGIIYAAGGAAAGEGIMSLLGAWLCLVVVAAAAAPMPWAYLVVAALGGGAFVAAAVVSRGRTLRIPGRAH